MHLRHKRRQIKGKPEQLKISGRLVSVFSTDLFHQEFVHGLVRGSTPTLISRCCTHDACSVFHKMTFQNVYSLYIIIYICNSEFITIGAITNTPTSNFYLVPDRRCIEAFAITEYIFPVSLSHTIISASTLDL